LTRTAKTVKPAPANARWALCYLTPDTSPRQIVVLERVGEAELCRTALYQKRNSVPEDQRYHYVMLPADGKDNYCLPVGIQ